MAFTKNILPASLGIILMLNVVRGNEVSKPTVLKPKPEPGTPCIMAYGDLVTCDTENTLLACLDESSSPTCGCVEDVIDLPYLSYSYSIDMVWNSTSRKCMSKEGSVCNVNPGEENVIILGHISTIPCEGGMICHPSIALPKEHGVCGSSGIGALKGLVVFGAWFVLCQYIG